MYMMYRCPKCGRKSKRLKSYFGVAECHACGTILKPDDTDERAYIYICPKCGNSFTGGKDEYRCEKCGYWYLVRSYDDINVQIYDEIYSNVRKGKKVTLECQECKEKAIFFGKAPGMTCKCGGFYNVDYSEINFGELLKKYRVEKKLKQKDIAEKFNISQELVSKIEKNGRNCPEIVRNYLVKKFKI